MRVVLVGPASLRQRLRSQLPDNVLVVGEAATISAGRLAASEADACVLLTPEAPDPPSIEPLTTRERQVLELYAVGLPAKSVARRLGVQIGTAKVYLKRIRAKYAALDRGAGTRVELYQRAIEDGFIDPPGVGADPG